MIPTTKKKKNHPDYVLIGACGFLIIIGVLILSSISATLSYEKFGDPFYFLRHQILFGLIPGVILAFFVFKINLNFLKKYSPILLLANLLLLGAVFIPTIGVSLGGATRWLDLKYVSIQPAEFLKLTFFLYIAAWLESKTQPQKMSFSKTFSKTMKPKRLQKLPSFGAGLITFFVLLFLISIFLIFQPNISTLAIIVLVGSLMYFSANTPFWHSILIISVISGTLWLLIKMVPYRASRILIFLNPDFDPMGKGYQLKQALIAIGSGGILGLGLGMSRQKFGFLPESMSDTFFSILAEEMGFIGGAFLVSLFLIFLWRGFKIAKRAPDKFSQLMALGISSWICFQALANIGSLIRVIPPTGIPLPFMSYGGSHLIAELIGLGILLNISRYSKN